MFTRLFSSRRGARGTSDRTKAGQDDGNESARKDGSATSALRFRAGSSPVERHPRFHRGGSSRHRRAAHRSRDRAALRDPLDERGGVSPSPSRTRATHPSPQESGAWNRDRLLGASLIFGTGFLLARFIPGTSLVRRASLVANASLIHRISRNPDSRKNCGRRAALCRRALR